MDEMERDLRWLEKNKTKELGCGALYTWGVFFPAHVSRFGPIVAGFTVGEVR